jgi:hypothetical protein
MSRLLILALACLASGLSAQNALDQSGPLNSRRTALMGDFNKAQAQLRAAKSEPERDSAHAIIADVADKAGALRSDIVRANDRVVVALNHLRDGKRDRSATIKAVTEKLTASNASLTALPIPSGPQFNAAEVNQVQRVLDACKVTLDLHRHACQNLR